MGGASTMGSPRFPLPTASAVATPPPRRAAQRVHGPSARPGRVSRQRAVHYRAARATARPLAAATAVAAYRWNWAGGAWAAHGHTLGTYIHTRPRHTRPRQSQKKRPLPRHVAAGAVAPQQQQQQKKKRRGAYLSPCGGGRSRWGGGRLRWCGGGGHDGAPREGPPPRWEGVGSIPHSRTCRPCHTPTLPRSPQWRAGVCPAANFRHSPERLFSRVSLEICQKCRACRQDEYKIPLYTTVFLPQ